jgi:hypothetical protein
MVSSDHPDKFYSFTLKYPATDSSHILQAYDFHILKLGDVLCYNLVYDVYAVIIKSGNIFPPFKETIIGNNKLALDRLT